MLQGQQALKQLTHVHMLHVPLDFGCKCLYAVGLADVQCCYSEVAVLSCKLLQLLRLLGYPGSSNDLV